MNPIPTATLMLVAYAVGSIPTGVWLARWKGLPDPRSSGSGNIGATNVARTLGRRMGIATLLGDVAKGLTPVLVARAAGADSRALALVAGAAVLGHTTSLFLGLRGGKGVATGVGAFLGAAPLPTLVTIAVFGATFRATRYVSLSSIVATAVLPIAMLAWPATEAGAPVAAVVSAWIIAKHHANIARLARRTEPKFGRTLT